MPRHTLAFCAAVAASSLLAPRSSAQTVAGVVVATRLPATVPATPGAYLLDRADLDRLGAVFAADALSTVPGLDVVRSGAVGGVTSLRQRGAPAGKTLVLVDGAPVNDPSQPEGPFDFRSLELDDVERIEVLSGPQGSLWGSDAIAGVVAFTTREINGARGSLESGSYGTVRGSAAIGRAGDAWALGLSASGLTTDGLSKADRAYGNAERDAFRTGTLGAYARVQANARLGLEARVRYNSARAEIDGFGCVANCTDASPADDVFQLTDQHGVSTSGSWSGTLRARIAGPLGFLHRLETNRLEQRRGDFGAYRGDRQVWRWTTERDPADASVGILLGAERTDSTAELASGEAADLAQTSLFAVARWRPANVLTLSGSLRHDNPDAAPGATTARAAAAVTLPGGVDLAASYGEGFKLPTVSQIVCDFCFPAGPSLGLRPERARGLDLGATFKRGPVSAGVTVYSLSIRDQIAYTAGRYTNVARTRSRGLEAHAEAELGRGLSLRAAYAWTRAEDRATDTVLLRVPRHTGSATLAWSGGRLEAASTLRAESSQADTGLDGFSRTRRPGFVTLDARGAYALTEQWKLTLRLENLFDTHHQQAFGYGEPRLSAYVGLSARY